MADFDEGLRKRGLLPLPFIDRLSSASKNPPIPRWMDKKLSIYPARTLAELDMCNLLATVRDQHQWARAWQDPNTRTKLAAEVHSTAEDWEMRECEWQYVLAELDYQAVHEPTASAVDNVFVSDNSMPSTLHAALLEHVAVLERVSDLHKGQHLDQRQISKLVDPFLHPFVQRRTLVLPEGAAKVTLDNWTTLLGSGTAIDSPIMDPLFGKFGLPNDLILDRLQWLPTEFSVDDDGKVEICSYINNLHPERHRSLYPLLARVFECALPLFERVLARLRDPVPLRIVPSPYSWYSHLGDDERDAPSAFQVMNGWIDNREPLIPPPETEFKLCTPLSLRGRTLKVVTKIGGVHLTLETPTFCGNMQWRVDGVASDAIVATSLYFFDLDNISDSKLAFRCGVQRIECDGDDRQGLDVVYGFKEWQSLVQECGAVTARPGRLVVYPNTLQHVWDDFTLVDKARAGHLKYVAFYLVDTSSAYGDLVVSTSRVPPQQADWVADVWAGPQRAFPPQVPREVVDMIVDKVDAVMTRDEALQLKHQLLREHERLAMLLDHKAYGGVLFRF
ncbi:hypothetical protein AMAG_09788 [Allomyces macrogynus ATCC 38327]|uniref:DUF4246 domain-containing protein n=1 Tax=Allomyces macrogynus (strain ATCC 38327) TaxID=578462 RepID=A0A0L0STH0_ALLM3|nr:hypothetical protein AMAG_09788 [Allomyces macrogynus ATCC 38327]|eukprot:KNE65817.1 hypothetical protein AMAG_09788 [Allomyces macrogynus ATCC 38327]